jgi:hypothetical protein
MYVDLLPWSCTTKKFVAFDIAQVKEKNYYDPHPIDQFLPLAIEIFECLFKHVDTFLHNCANVIWSLKGWKGPPGPPLFVLVTFLCKKNSITLRKMQASSILSRIVVIG